VSYPITTLNFSCNLFYNFFAPNSGSDIRMGRALSATQAAVGVLVLLRPLDVQSCTSFNTETTTTSHLLCSNLTLILHGQSPPRQYPLYLVLSVASTSSSNSLSMAYYLMLSLNFFMLGYKLAGSIIRLFRSNITLSPGRG
jgi:hypothetical protein